MKCRHCQTALHLTLADLGSSPPSNAYLSASELNAAEAWIPLRVLVCESCWLAQTEDFRRAEELFGADYGYFSSYSSSWLLHAREYAKKMTPLLQLNENSLVIEVASNDGYLLQYFKEEKIPCLGIEPTRSTALAAEAKGLRVIQQFFGKPLAEDLANQGVSAELMIANNVLAHVPDINDFVSGFARLLKPDGIATFEFPHLLNLIKYNLFDTIYHEHYSYLSLLSVSAIFRSAGLSIFDVEELPTHGGSLRLYAQKTAGKRPVSPSVERILKIERLAGLATSACYQEFQHRAQDKKFAFLSFLISAKSKGKKIGAYGAAAKGNTFLNYAGIRSDLIPWVVDRNPAKQNMFMPGSRIPIVNEERVRNEKPDYLILLPWNLRLELIEQLAYIREWNGQFVVALPELEVLK